MPQERPASMNAAATGWRSRARSTRIGPPVRWCVLGTDAGIEGVGEATVTPTWSGETVVGRPGVIDHVLGAAVLGCDPQRHRRD